MPAPAPTAVPHIAHEFRSPRGVLLGSVCVYPSQLQPGWVHYEVLRVVGGTLYIRAADHVRVGGRLDAIAEGEAPSEAEAVRIAKFLVER